MEPTARHELLATINPGLEFVLAAEVTDKLGADAQSIQAEANQGKCFFTSSGHGEALQSPENVFAVVSRLDSATVRSLSPSALAALSPDAAAGLTPAAVHALSAGHAAAFGGELLRALQPGRKLLARSCVSFSGGA